MSTRLKCSVQQEAQVIELYIGKPISVLAIARRLGLTRSIVRGIINTLGIYRPRRRSVIVYCPQCGKEFRAQPARLTNGKDKYCSRECSNQAQRRRIGVFCANCGKAIDKKPADIGRTAHQFCTLECFHAWYIGPNHFAWRGGGASRRGLGWADVKRIVKARDKICQRCGAKKADVHHVIPYRITHDNSPENLILLCRSCHAKADAALRKQERRCLGYAIFPTRGAATIS